jgi:hypothetical protein
MIIVAKIIKAPFFYVAVEVKQILVELLLLPSLLRHLVPFSSVGVLLAVLGYAVGTYGAYACGLLLQYFKLSPK